MTDTPTRKARLLAFVRREGILPDTHSDETILSMTLLELATTLAYRDFDDGAIAFTDEIMKQIEEETEGEIG